jgi:hypothetical protein
MKHIWKTLLLLLALATATQNSYAQDVTTQGKEFWLSFMGNGFRTNGSPSYVLTQVMVSSKRNCSGTITNPNTNWSRSFEVAANNITLIDIPEEQAYNGTSDYEIANNKGLMIVTSDTVTVYCTNIATNSFDASYVLPIQALADEYIIQTYEQSTSYSVFGMQNISNYLTSAFLIVATEDNTTIDITPSINTLGGRPANQEFSITLQKGESYQVRSTLNGNQRDLSGSRVVSRDCKRIAVFNGNTLTTIPDVDNGYDHIFEQAMPLRSWGKQFVITQSFSRKRDFVKVTSAADDNVIKQNGIVIATLNSGESYSFEIDRNEKSCYIETSAPSGVYLYNTTSSDDGGNHTGDPSMLWIAPVEQKMTEVTFTTFSGDENHNSSIAHHYVNIIVDSDDTGSVYFDNTLLSSSSFDQVTGNPSFSFIRKEISHNVHHISCANGFNAQVYGFGQDRGYAYLVGSKATDLSTVITVDDLTVAPGDTVNNCDLATLSFHAEVSFDNYDLKWDFGDGFISTQTSPTHTYEQDGLYQVTLTVATEGNSPCQDSTFNTSVFYISAGKMPDQNYYDTICFTGPDTYEGYGFSFPYSEAETYTKTRTIINDNGCETIITLNLEIRPIIDTEPETVSGLCDAYEWHGNIYTSSGHYTDTISDPAGCFTLHHLDLELQYSPHPTEIFPVDTANHAPHWVITATEFQIISYEFTLYDSIPGNVQLWDSVKWEFEDPNVQWVLERDETTSPIGKKCKMYVLNHIEDTVWLRATAYNDCNLHLGDSIEPRRYWFVCSFYGIDEDNPSTGAEAFDLDISPNPNNGEMNIHFGEMEGLVNATVYDMQGQTVDRFSLEAIPKSRHSYALVDKKSGIYLFVFNYNGHLISKKIIIKN